MATLDSTLNGEPSSSIAVVCCSSVSVMTSLSLSSVVVGARYKGDSE